MGPGSYQIPAPTPRKRVFIAPEVSRTPDPTAPQPSLAMSASSYPLSPEDVLEQLARIVEKLPASAALSAELTIVSDKSKRRRIWAIASTVAGLVYFGADVYRDLAKDEAPPAPLVERVEATEKALEDLGSKVDAVGDAVAALAAALEPGPEPVIPAPVPVKVRRKH